MLSVRLDDEVKSTIEDIAKREGRDASYMVRQAINSYIEVYNEQIKMIEECIPSADRGELISEEEFF